MPCISCFQWLWYKLDPKADRKSQDITGGATPTSDILSDMKDEPKDTVTIKFDDDFEVPIGLFCYRKSELSEKRFRKLKFDIMPTDDDFNKVFSKPDGKEKQKDRLKRIMKCRQLKELRKGMEGTFDAHTDVVDSTEPQKPFVSSLK